MEAGGTQLALGRHFLVAGSLFIVHNPKVPTYWIHGPGRNNQEQKGGKTISINTKHRHIINTKHSMGNVD